MTLVVQTAKEKVAKMNSVKKKAVMRKKLAPKKTVARKKTTRKKASHPLMKDLKSWDREKTLLFICGQIATSSRGLSTILADGYEGLNLPAYSNVMVWLNEDDRFQELYARAKEAQADYLADEMIDIADDARNDYMERFDADGKSTGFILDKEHVARSRLRIETRKWLMGKLKPKKYGEKMDVNHGGQADNPLYILARAVQGAALLPKKKD